MALTNSENHLLLAEILFADSKKVWYGAGNRSNPEYKKWLATSDDVPMPPERVAADVPRNFDLEFLREMGSDVARMAEYLRDVAMYIGSGSSRLVFAVSPRMVVKLAGGSSLDAGRGGRWADQMVNAGRYQNRHEFELWEKHGRQDVVGRLLPRCFDIADDGSWLLSELVRPLKDEGEFMALTGLDEDGYYRLMNTLERGGFGIEYAKNFVADMEGDGESSAKALSFVLLMQRLQAREPWLKVGDLGSMEQWGKGSDGRLVILDTGADETLIKRYYDE
jgi:hypothetical protein